MGEIASLSTMSTMERGLLRDYACGRSVLIGAPDRMWRASVHAGHEHAERKRAMKTSLMFGVLCASLSLVAGASAQSMSELQRQAYDAGWDAADEFCDDLRPSAGDRLLSARMRASITEVFKEYCGNGYDEYIDNNQACGTRLRETTNGYTRMWEARRNACR
jgi:hypothetical protein